MISFPGFSCLQATIAWGGPHSMGHSVFHTALTQMRKILLLSFFSCPFSHDRGTIHGCMIDNCTCTCKISCEFTFVSIYLNYAPTAIFCELTTTLTIGQFCFNPSTLKSGQKSWRLGTPCSSTIT